LLVGNAAEMFFENGAANAARPAVVESDRSVSYGDLVARAGAIAAALSRSGVEPGDRVAIMLRRGADAAAAFFGALAAGAVAVIVNELLRARQVEYILDHSGPRTVLTSREVTDRLQRSLDTGASLLHLPELLPLSADFQPRPRAATDPAQIIYTSGSTGLPKGVTLSHANLWAGMRAVVEYLGISRDDRIASLLPFSFDYGLNQLLCCAGTGATLVVERSPVAPRIVRSLQEQEVTVLAAVPPLWLQLLGVEAFRDEPLRSLRVMTNSGGHLPIDAVRKLRRCQPHADLVLMYGLTEAFRSTYLRPAKVDEKPGSIGQAIPGAEMLVLNDDLAPCEPGEVGQLVHRGPTVALGYWNDAEATSEVFRPNPLQEAGAETVVFSGDLVYRDTEGDLFFVGRRDTMIKTLGFRVSPDEVVDVLYASGEVAEAVVTAEPDELRGACIVAFVVLSEHGDLGRLEAFAAREMPRYMQPARIEVRSALSRTPSGKHDIAATARSADDPA
jgi:amino acid adenylation domain-containing protein